MPVSETVAWEHSEPGTGPVPVQMNPEQSKDIANGWRLGTPPVARDGHEDPFMEPLPKATGDLEF